MNNFRLQIPEVLEVICDAIETAIGALKEGRVEHEPALTDRILGGIEQSIKGFHSRGINWNAKTLTDRSAVSQESRFGADFMGVLDVDLPTHKIEKGFLAQAKMVRNGTIADMADLKKQCAKMLKHSAAAFVFLYDQKGVRVIPAATVIAPDFKPRDPRAKPAKRFFSDHLRCRTGDHGIARADSESLELLRLRYDAQRVILLEARPGD